MSLKYGSHVGLLYFTSQTPPSYSRWSNIEPAHHQTRFAVVPYGKSPGPQPLPQQNPVCFGLHFPFLFIPPQLNHIHFSAVCKWNHCYIRFIALLVCSTLSNVCTHSTRPRLHLTCTIIATGHALSAGMALTVISVSPRVRARVSSSIRCRAA